MTIPNNFLFELSKLHAMFMSRVICVKFYNMLAQLYSLNKQQAAFPYYL